MDTADWCFTAHSASPSAGSIDPVLFFGSLNAAQAATRNWALNLHNKLADTDVYVAHVAIGVGIGEAAPELALADDDTVTTIAKHLEPDAASSVAFRVDPPTIRRTH